jgi:phosphoglycolate phosphatase
MVGATLHDYEVAQAIGIDCILLASGHCNRSRLEATGLRVFENIEDLLKHL